MRDCHERYDLARCTTWASEREIIDEKASVLRVAEIVVVVVVVYGKPYRIC